MKTIKKTLSLVACSVLMIGLNSCHETVTKDEHDNAMMELIGMEGAKQDSIERLYITTLDEIDCNLDLVRDQYGELVMGPKSNGDFVPNKKEQIINNITMINGLLAENRTKINTLEKSLSKYKKGKAELIKSIALSKDRVEQQEKQIEQFKVLLSEKDFKIEQLNQSVTTKDKEIENLAITNKNQETILNTTYFAYGTYKELRDRNIIKKQGGVLGINKTKILNENLDKAKFAELDKTKTVAIPMIGKNPKVISTHPVNTYTIEKTGEDIATLTIKDPDSFWKVSKYLVVEVN